VESGLHTRIRPRAIALLGRSAEALAETKKQVQKISPATRVVCIVVDVLDESRVGATFEEIVTQAGVPDVLINNAGYCKLDTIAESSVESFWKVQVRLNPCIQSLFPVSKRQIENDTKLPLIPNSQYRK
jgi:NADP-dependent 3-hydroxy acid dehydrogenase YdfG